MNQERPADHNFPGPESEKEQEISRELRLPSDKAIAEAANICEEIDEKLESLGWTEDEIGWFGRLMVKELLVNAAEHGNNRDPGKFVEIETHLTKDSAVALVRDQGKGFDKQEVPSPTTEEGVLGTHGRGIYIIDETPGVTLTSGEVFKDGIKWHEERLVREHIVKAPVSSLDEPPPSQ